VEVNHAQLIYKRRFHVILLNPAVLWIVNWVPGITLPVSDVVRNVCDGHLEQSLHLLPAVVNPVATDPTLVPATYQITLDARVILFLVLNNLAHILLGVNGVLATLPVMLLAMLHNNAVTVN